jgi:hypothetical protein
MPLFVFPWWRKSMEIKSEVLGGWKIYISRITVLARVSSNLPETETKLAEKRQWE